MQEPFYTLFQTQYACDARPLLKTKLAEFPNAQKISNHDIVAIHTDDGERVYEIIAQPAICWVRERTRDIEGSTLPMKMHPVLLHILDALSPYDGTIRIQPKAYLVRDYQDIETATIAIRDERRRLPIAVMSEPADEALLACTEELYGIAHVFHVANRLSHALMEHLGPDFPVYGGAIRTFSSPFISDPQRHPIVLAVNRPSPLVFIARLRRVATAIARNSAFPSFENLQRGAEQLEHAPTPR